MNHDPSTLVNHYPSENAVVKINSPMMMRSRAQDGHDKSIPSVRPDIRLSLARGRRDTSPGKRSVASNMSMGRRDKLLSLQKRERLTELLVHKFGLKYGKSRSAMAYVEAEVKNFVKGKNGLTEDALSGLERTIKEHLRRKSKGGGSRQGGQQPGVGSNQEHGPPSGRGGMGGGMGMGMSGGGGEGGGAQGGPGSTGGSMNALGLSTSAPNLRSTNSVSNDEWAIITQYRKKQYEEEQAAKKDAKVRKKVEVRSALAQQCELKISMRKEAQVQQQKFHTDQLKEIGEWKEKEEAKKVRVRPGNSLLRSLPLRAAPCGGREEWGWGRTAHDIRVEEPECCCSGECVGGDILWGGGGTPCSTHHAFSEANSGELGAAGSHLTAVLWDCGTAGGRSVEVEVESRSEGGIGIA
jgi:hypothetical protein